MFNLLFGQKNSALWTAKIGFAKFSDFTNKGWRSVGTGPINTWGLFLGSNHKKDLQGWLEVWTWPDGRGRISFFLRDIPCTSTLLYPTLLTRGQTMCFTPLVWVLPTHPLLLYLERVKIHTIFCCCAIWKSVIFISLGLLHFHF